MDDQEQNGSEPLTTERLEEVVLIVEAREGSSEAFARLVARYEQPVVYFLRRLIGSPEAALDAHQEVWIEAFRGLRRLEKPEAFRAWLYRIARAKAARFIRREIREAGYVQALSEEQDAINGESEWLDAEAVHRALDRLPVPQREALTLHYLRDLSLEEIASVLDCPLGTVKSRLHHGRESMRALLEKEKAS